MLSRHSLVSDRLLWVTTTIVTRGVASSIAAAMRAYRAAHVSPAANARRSSASAGDVSATAVSSIAMKSSAVGAMWIGAGRDATSGKDVDTTGFPPARYSYNLTGSVASVIGLTLNGIVATSK